MCIFSLKPCLTQHTPESKSYSGNKTRHSYDRTWWPKIFVRQTQETRFKYHFEGDCYNCDATTTNVLQRSGFCIGPMACSRQWHLLNCSCFWILTLNTGLSWISWTIYFHLLFNYMLRLEKINFDYLYTPTQLHITISCKHLFTIVIWFFSYSFIPTQLHITSEFSIHNCHLYFSYFHVYFQYVGSCHSFHRIYNCTFHKFVFHELLQYGRTNTFSHKILCCNNYK